MSVVFFVTYSDNNSESSANNLPLFSMSGDGQTDIIIPMVFLFGVEAARLMDALRVHDNLVVYIGETAKQSSMSHYIQSRVSTTPGNPGNLLEFKNTPGNTGNLLEFNGPPGNFCVRCSTALVSGHKTGYQIA